MQQKNIITMAIGSLKKIVLDDKKNIFYLLYYSLLEAILLMVSPLASAFIINSVLAHATVSIAALSVVVIIVFGLITFLKILKVYMIEKFEQKIFVKNAIEISQLSLKIKNSMGLKSIDKYMNYFFDVISIQKLFPVLLLSGTGVVVKVFASLVLLLIFDFMFFALAIFFLLVLLVLLLFLGRKGPSLAVARSDAKHESIYYIQSIPSLTQTDEKTMQELDTLLVNFTKARDSMFQVIVKQLSLTFILEGVILSSFFIVGGYLVFQGLVPIGEFVAVEIIIISVVNALRGFMNQVDYIYDAIEGFYKINKLSHALEDNQ